MNLDILEDEWVEKQLEKYLHEELFISSCCGMEMEEDSNMCPDCDEYCTPLTEAEVEQNMLDDIADDKYQQMKDEG